MLKKYTTVDEIKKLNKKCSKCGHSFKISFLFMEDIDEDTIIICSKCKNEHNVEVQTDDKQ